MLGYKLLKRWNKVAAEKRSNLINLKLYSGSHEKPQAKYCGQEAPRLLLQ